ncbi:MAG: L-threonylcarbamoyladenylate synthase [Smithellaceae bacterium]|nr:L-threonylcarbamoyladenylate synthase [Smithellaceae bacterium]
MHHHKSAIFLDRDGTLIEDAGVLSNPEDIRLFPDTIDALRQLQKKYFLFVVTNQPGIANGLVTAGQVAEMNKSLDGILSQEGIHIRQWYVCPHARKDRCQCIKPNPEFLLQAAKDYDLDLRQSFVIGDHPHDVLTGEAVGAFGLYLLTGHGPKHLDELPQDKLIFHTLGNAAGWILKHPNAERDITCDIQLGAEAIRRGGLVAFPTETVYGLGADVFNTDAVARIFEVKQRPLHNPLIVHVSEQRQVKPLVTHISRTAEKLMERFWPGPLTLVLPKADIVPDIVTAGNPTVAVRMPANKWARELITRSQTPVAAPSANAFGRTSPTTARHVEDQLHGGYDVLIDGGACRVGIESTVLSLAGSTPLLLRPGGVSQEEIVEITKAIEIFHPQNKTGKRFESPGMMFSHYAPSTPLLLVDDVEPYANRSDVGVILFQNSAVCFQSPASVLSPSGNLREAAANLYQVMRKLDAMGLSLIVAQRVPNNGLGAAINDRLNKASLKSPPPPMCRNEFI